MAQTFQNFSISEDCLCPTVDTFQVLDCNGDPVGTPQDVIKTVVINNVGVKDCNSDAFLTALQAIQANTTTSNANEALIITALGDILTQVIAVNANTDTIEASLTQLITDQQAGNVTLTEIKTALDALLPELQAINANTDTVEALITDTNTKLDTLIAEQDKELIVTTPQEACVDNLGVKTKVFVRTEFIYDSETATLVSETVKYSADGITGWSTTAPTGTITLGACPVVATTPTVYNINETQLAQNSAVTLAATTYHSVSVAVLSGSVTIDVNGVSFVAPAGYSNSWEADELLVNVITITSASATDLAVVDTIK